MDKNDPIFQLAGRLRDLQNQAYEIYAPIVSEIIRTQTTDKNIIEHALDRLLDFCGNEKVLALFRKLCGYYYFIDPSATAFYVKEYRDMFDSEDEPLPQISSQPSATGRKVLPKNLVRNAGENAGRNAGQNATDV